MAVPSLGMMFLKKTLITINIHQSLFSGLFVKPCSRSIFWSRLVLLVGVIFEVVFPVQSQAMSETSSLGSFIINMGVTLKTPKNGLRPCEMIYDLPGNYQASIKWVVNDSGVKDGTGFIYNDTSYRDGLSMILAEFCTSVPVFAIQLLALNWTLDRENRGITAGFFSNASIPSSANGSEQIYILLRQSLIFTKSRFSTQGRSSSLILINRV